MSPQPKPAAQRALSRLRTPAPLTIDEAAGLESLEQEHGGTVLDFAAIRSHFSRKSPTSEGDPP